MRSLLITGIFLLLLPACALRVGPQCEGLNRVGYDLPVSPSELTRIKARGFENCAAYIQRNNLVRPAVPADVLAKAQIDG